MDHCTMLCVIKMLQVTAFKHRCSKKQEELYIEGEVYRIDHYGESLSAIINAWAEDSNLELSLFDQLSQTKELL